MRLFLEHPMEARLDFAKTVPQALRMLLGFEAYLSQCGLEARLLHLVVMRASQINGCAYCLDMHSKDARAEGEAEQRLYALDAWSETPFFSERERAALLWTEAVTLVREGHVPDAVYESVRGQFSSEELANLTLAITMINTWNRLNIAFRTVPGNYRAGMYRHQLEAFSQRGTPQTHPGPTAPH
jgi:AhpD family alkylhydroperoxidase